VINLNIIRLLDEITIDKIAAGEVVENPASVVKELVENSIDAGAKEIIIEIKNGGKAYIRVTDNGYGISNDDLSKSIIRHATSKIKVIDDLNSLHTLGFRGEALSSISAVSKFEVTSKSKNESIGKTINVAGGKIISEKLSGAPDGTTIIVRDLFFNVPARKKFLKSDRGEASAVSDLVVRLSLANTDISFKFIRDGEVVLTTPSNTSIINVIGSVMGSDFSKALDAIDFESDDISAKIFFTNLNYYRVSRKMQLIYVNGRYVTNKNISAAIENAYGTLIPKGKFPGFILYITINPENIDVNIHPQKSIIKFDNISVIEDLLYSMISKKLRSKFLSKNVGSSIPDKSKKAEHISKLNTIKASNFPDNNLDFFSKDNSFSLENSIIIDDIDDIMDVNDSNYTIDSDETTNISVNNNFTDVSAENTVFEESLFIEYNKDNNSDKVFDIVIEQLEYVGSLFKTYLIFEDSFHSDMYLMDQHAAHERINYEKYVKEFNNKKIAVQNLLIPETVHLDMEDYEKALSSLSTFEKMGFDVSDFGSKSIIISAIPVILSDGNIKDMFFEILDNIEIKRDNLILQLDKLIKKACTASIKAGDKINPKEISSFISQLFMCNAPYTCPHGRPIWIKLSKYDIEKYFNRVG
jgi:DNA mismatch repair protein MutL